MKKSLGKKYVCMLAVFVSIVFYSSRSMAAGPYQPYLNYSGFFNYTETTDKLTFSSITMSEVHYLGSTSGTSCSGSTDLICGAFINIGSLYNDDLGDSYHFDDTAGVGGVGVTFEITDGTYTFLTATLAPIDIINAYSGFATTSWFNLNLTEFNLNNVSYGTGFSSQYISELQSVVATGESMQFQSTFTHTSGTGSPLYNFVGDTGGSVAGIVSAPEPVSSVLFLTGGAAFAVRRFLNRGKRIS